MGIERANLEDVVGSLASALVELIGKFSTMVAQWRTLEASRWLEWIEEDDVVLPAHFSYKSERFS